MVTPFQIHSEKKRALKAVLALLFSKLRPAFYAFVLDFMTN